MIFFTKPK